MQPALQGLAAEIRGDGAPATIEAFGIIELIPGAFFCAGAANRMTALSLAYTASSRFFEPQSCRQALNSLAFFENLMMFGIVKIPDQWAGL